MGFYTKHYKKFPLQKNVEGWNQKAGYVAAYYTTIVGLRYLGNFGGILREQGALFKDARPKKVKRPENVDAHLCSKKK